MKKQQGFTLVEVTIILLVLVILGTIMLPQLGNYNRLARFVKVREDVGALCASMKKMLDEVMGSAFYRDPRGTRWNEPRQQPVGLLIGPGRSPLEGSKDDGKSGIRGDRGHWLYGVDETFRVPVDSGNYSVRYYVDALEDHLQQNYYGYKNPLDDPDEHNYPGYRGGAGAFFGWRGPYFDWLASDPWGNAYLVNVFALHKDARSYNNDDIHTSAVVCYSAGPDGSIDTIFNQPMNDADGDGYYGWRFMDDDQGAILSAGGTF